jgi:glycerophosphoryl diester phosphodiesterase
VSAEEELTRFLATGIDGIFTDHTDLAVQVLRDIGTR